jgi:hypothetical protein
VSTYDEFLARKAQLTNAGGFEPVHLRRSRWARSPREPSQKPQRRTGPGAEVVQLVAYRSAGCCEVCGNDWATQRHHRRPRASGGSRRPDTNGAANLIALCLRCHSEIESKRNWAIIHGRLLQQHQDPATTPVLLRHGWVLLTAAGSCLEVERVEPAG